MEPKSSKNASKCKMKRYQKKEPIFDRFLVDFWVDLGRVLGAQIGPLGSQIPPQGVPGHARTAKIAQERPKIRLGGQLGAILAPSWPNLAPFWLHLGPTWSILRRFWRPKSVQEADAQDARRRPKSRFLVKFWCFALTTSRLLPQCSFMILILSSPIIQTRVFRAFRFTACRSRFVRQVIGETSDVNAS